MAALQASSRATKLCINIQAFCASNVRTCNMAAVQACSRATAFLNMNWKMVWEARCHSMDCFPIYVSMSLKTDARGLEKPLLAILKKNKLSFKACIFGRIRTSKTKHATFEGLLAFCLKVAQRDCADGLELIPIPSFHTQQFPCRCCISAWGGDANGILKSS